MAACNKREAGQFICAFNPTQSLNWMSSLRMWLLIHKATVACNRSKASRVGVAADVFGPAIPHDVQELPVLHLVFLVGGTVKTRHAGLLVFEMLRGILFQEFQQVIGFRPVNRPLAQKFFNPVDGIEQSLVLDVNCRHPRRII